MRSQPEPAAERLARRLLPPGSELRNRLTSSSALRRLSTDNRAYRRWVAGEPSPQPFPAVDGDPLISIVVPAFNTPPSCVAQLVASVGRQTYDRWELCLVDGSTQPAARNVLADAASHDPRIKYRALHENRGIAGNTNVGLEMATGDFVAFLDHDDTLAASALEHVIRQLRLTPDVDLFYSDEDKVTSDGRARFDPFFKPDWSPDLFLAVNYLAHFVVVRSSAVSGVGGLRESFEGAQDYDFLLRLTETTPRIHHIPEVSYHWRTVKGSTARWIGSKAASPDAGKRALRERLSRSGVNAAVDDIEHHPTHYRLTYPSGGPCRVRVSTSDGSVPDWLRASAVAAGVALVTDHSDLTLFVDAAVRVEGHAWLVQLIGAAKRPETGMVASLVLDRAGHVVEAGYFVDKGYLAAAFAGLLLDSWTLAGAVWWPRNLVVPGVRLCMVRSALIDDASNESPEAIALRLHRSGTRNVLWPFATARADGCPPTTSGMRLAEVDPYLNRRLTVSRGRPVLAGPAA